MKKTQVLELFKNIKSTFMSFFSIMMFVALSVGIFVGISWTGPALQKSAEQVFEQGNFHDFEIQFPYGLTDENLTELKDKGYADEIEAGYMSFQTIKRNGRDYVVKVMSLNDEIDVPKAVEGRLPEKRNEIVLNTEWAEKQELKVGDKIKFVHDGGSKEADGMKYLKEDEFTITGTMDSPAYIAKNTNTFGFSNIGTGNIQLIAYIPGSCFDKDEYLNGYPDVVLRLDDLRGDSTLSSDYREASARINEYLEKLGLQRAADRCKQIRDDAKKKIKAGEAKLARAKKQIDDGAAQIAAGEKKLAQGKAQLAAGKKKLAAGKKQLDKYQAMFDKVKGPYQKAESMKKKLEEALKKYKDDAEIAEDLAPVADLYNSDRITPEERKRIDKKVKEVADALADYGYEGLHERYLLIFKTNGGKIYYKDLKYFLDEINRIEKEYEKYSKMLSDGWAQYYAGLRKLKDGERQIAAGEALLAKKKQELAAARKQYKAGQARLAAAKKQLAAMKDYEWTVLSREGNGGVQALNKFSDITNKLRYSMAMLFIIIGLLVSYSAISRIVRDQIISIGTKKALGLRRREITLSYLTYSGVAVLIGSIIGLLVGVLGIEPFLGRVLGDRFVMGAYDPIFIPSQAVLVVCIELGLIMMTAWLACRKLMKEHAVELLKGAKPPTGRMRFFEKWKLWDRLPLFSKTIVNNCLNDKKRVFSTIIGVAGCTALIVTAVSLNNNVQNSFDKQFADVYHYDTVVRYDSGDRDARKNIEAVLHKEGMTDTPVYTSSFVLEQPDGRDAVTTMTVPFDEEEFRKFVTADTSKNESTEEYADGALVNMAYGKHMDADVGDKIRILDSNGQPHEFTIQGFYPHYLINNQIIVSREAYEKVFKEDCRANALLTDSKGAGYKNVKKLLKDTAGIRTIKDEYGWAKSFFDEFSQITTAVITIYLLLSVLMAIVVLLDLNAVFIEEKRRELIIMMINGFSSRDAKKYIYRDTIVLTVIGILLGIIVGIIMGDITVMSVEPNNAYFLKGIEWVSCGIGAVTSAVLAVAMCLISLRRVSKFKLADINKM